MINLSAFKVSSYPDGHKHIVSNLDLHGDDTLSVSIKSFDDLFLVAQVRRIHPELTCLHILYMLAARCDRRFSPGEAVDLKIVCDYIKSLKFDTVSIVKPHSYITHELMAPEYQISVYDPTYMLLDMLYKSLYDNVRVGQCDVVHISPDAGASRWISDLRLKNVIQCEKKRDPATGAVAGVTVPNLEKYANYENFVIVDDLCDGGATFTTIAKEIKLTIPEAKVYLVVTHAIFSKGFQPFEGLIDHIFCTNSFANFENPIVTQLDIR